VALNAPRTWLIAYDIRDPRRLRRVHGYLRQQAIPVQYSVFVTRCSATRVGAIRAALAQIVDSRVDDVRIYHVPDRAEVITFGTKTLPDGIQLLQADARPQLVPFTSAGERTTLDSPHEAGKGG
jgi:CRISPR-associated protein Cas2